jgi:cysteinyl-tRNA synthetase
MKTLMVYNSLTRKKEEFIPLTPGKVSIYTCGLTVQDYCHLGHARMDLIWDTIKRILKRMGYQVYHVQNFTDVNEKIAAKAIAQGQDPLALAQYFIDAYFNDMKGLEVAGADLYCRVTENMDEIIRLIGILVDKGNAYAKEGNVYFRVASDPSYGELSGRRIEEMQAGARLEVEDHKEHPGDFALWTVAQPGEPVFESPWGPGTPGWHIECSAMSCKYLGESYDMHGGGVDILFPHHENELAQSRCACGHEYAKYWVHHGMLTLPGGEKMSKSLNNFFRVKDLLEQVPAHLLRFFILSAHYRSPLAFSQELLEQSQVALERLQNTVQSLRNVKAELVMDDAMFEEALQKADDAFWNALYDDFNTSEAIAVLFELNKQVNQWLASAQINRVWSVRILSMYADWAEILGFASAFQEDEAMEEDLHAEVEALIVRRQEARKVKDWAAADTIRNQLESMGILIKDTPQGVQWQKK